MSVSHHHRSLSRESHSHRQATRSPSPPTQTFHPSILPHLVPTPALVESVAGGAHYAGVRVDADSSVRHRRSSTSQSHTVLKHDHQRILDDLTELYCCRPTLEIFERSWNPEAEFEDPLTKCKGYRQYAAQWFAMPRLFSNSEQISRRVMSSTDSPNRLIYHQVQEYTTRLFKKKKIIDSIITVDLDENEKIIRLVDKWDGKELPVNYGASFLRSLSAKAFPWFISVPKA